MEWRFSNRHDLEGHLSRSPRLRAAWKPQGRVMALGKRHSMCSRQHFGEQADHGRCGMLSC